MDTTTKAELDPAKTAYNKIVAETTKTLIGNQKNSGNVEEMVTLPKNLEPCQSLQQEHVSK